MRSTVAFDRRHSQRPFVLPATGPEGSLTMRREHRCEAVMPGQSQPRYRWFAVLEEAARPARAAAFSQWAERPP